MNDQTSNSKSEQPNAMRRRLTKGGLAAPVVLASLASKPVLADFNFGVPWICTLSGQLSGNMSGHENESCTQGSTTTIGLQADYPDPGQGASTIKALFTPALTEDLLFYSGSSDALSLDSQYPAATVNQALTKGTLDTETSYAQKALVILLNAKNHTDTSRYPLTQGQAINLFVAACKRQNFVDTNPNINWGYEQVKVYIDLLYPSGFAL